MSTISIIDLCELLIYVNYSIISDSLLPLIPEAPFSNLLHNESDDLSKNGKDEPSDSSTQKSNPIIIPSKNNKESPSSPQYSSSGDSFVFVELKAPFASDEQHELGSFFNGPSPTFTGSCTDSNCDISDITVQLAEMESNAQQWDSFVESICCDGEKEE